MRERTTRSYIAVTEAVAPTVVLLGGVKKIESCRLDSKSLAQQMVDQTVEANKRVGREAKGEVIESHLSPQIFLHCGTEVQTFNARCPGCGKMLTFHDAMTAPLRD